MTRKSFSQTQFSSILMRPCVLLVPSLCGFALCTQVAAAPLFTTFDIPGGDRVVPQGINATGTVTGYFFGSDGTNHGFLRAADATITTFDFPGAALTTPAALNDGGTIIGYYALSGAGPHGFIRKADGSFTTFDAPQSTGTRPESINKKGWIAGVFFKKISGNNALCFVRSPAEQFITFSINESIENCSINADGTVAGNYRSKLHFNGTYSTGGFIRAVDGTITKFDSELLGKHNSANSLNDAGSTAGNYSLKRAHGHGIMDYFGFVRGADGTIASFSFAGNPIVNTTSINAKGVAVGDYQAGSPRGFERSAGGKITAVNPAGSAFTYSLYNNSKGVIAGSYIDADDAGHGFIRTP